MSKAPLQRQASDTADSVSRSAFLTLRSTSTSMNKRRKRGTRRGKGNNGNQTPPLVASVVEPGAMADFRAEAGQKLAHEISHISHSQSDVPEEVLRTMAAPPRVPSVVQPSTSSMRSGNSRQSVASGQSGSSTSTTTRHIRRVPYKPPSMWGVPEALCTNNAATTSRLAFGKGRLSERYTSRSDDEFCLDTEFCLRDELSRDTGGAREREESCRVSCARDDEFWRCGLREPESCLRGGAAAAAALPPVADDAASTILMDIANMDNMSITSFAMGSGPMGKFASPPGRRKLSPPRAQVPRPPREPSPTPLARTEPRPHMSVAAANVTDLITGLNVLVSPTTLSTAQSSSFSLDTNPVRERHTLEGNSPHSRPRNFGSPSPSRSVASVSAAPDFNLRAIRADKNHGVCMRCARSPCVVVEKQYSDSKGVIIPLPVDARST
ncbi:hypothetical protein EV714DRAFT_269506 [Schizophyllum commune]